MPGVFAPQPSGAWTTLMMIAAYAFAQLFLREYVQHKPLCDDLDEQAFWNSFRHWSRAHLD